MMIEEEQTEEV